VEAGKKAATRLLQLQHDVREKFRWNRKDAEKLARAIDADPEDVFHVLQHLATTFACADCERVKSRRTTSFRSRNSCARSGAEGMSSSKQPPDKSPTVAWPDVVKFVRQLSHDIRNNLNAVELQSAYSPSWRRRGNERRDSGVARDDFTNRNQSAAGDCRLNQANPNLIPYQPADFVEDFKEKLTKEFPDTQPR